jgi:hypothetical protein
VALIAPAEVPQMIGKGQGDLVGSISDIARSTPTW